MVALSTEIFAPIDQLGCATACAGVTAFIRSRVQSRNGPPLAVKIRRRTSAIRPPARHWNSALCSESTGNSVAPLRSTAAIISAPADTSDSLLASATVRPCSIAAMVGSSPAQPTMAAIVQSGSISAASTNACLPAATRVPVPDKASFRS